MLTWLNKRLSYVFSNGVSKFPKTYENTDLGLSHIGKHRGGVFHPFTIFRKYSVVVRTISPARTFAGMLPGE